MENSKRRLVLEEQHPNALRTDYKLGDQTFKRYQVIEKILNLLKEKQMTMDQVAETLQMERIVTRNLFKFLREHLIVENTGKKKGDHFLYKPYQECLLAELFHPKPEDVEKSFKIKSRKRFKVDEGTSKSSGTSHGHVYYGDTYYSSHHWET